MLRQSFGQALRLGAMTFGLLALACLGDAQPALEKAKTDQAGDPLPPGALARMGTLRWRHGEAVSFVAFTPDGKAVLTAANDNTIRLWDRETGKEIRRFQVATPQPALPGGRPAAIGWGMPGQGASRIALSSDGKTLAVVLTNNTVQLLDLNTGKEIRQHKQDKAPIIQINTILFAPDGKSYATRGYDRTTYLFETDTGKEIRQIKAKQQKAAGGFVVINGQITGAEGLAFSHDGKTIATAEMEFDRKKATTCVKLSETDTGKEIRQINVAGGISSIAYSPNGKILAFSSGTTVHLREADTGKEIRTIDNGNAILRIAFASDSKTIAVKRRDQVVRLYETDTGKHTHEIGSSVVAPGANINFIGFGQPEARDFAFSHDSKFVALGGAQVVRFFTAATGKEQAAAGGHTGTVSALVISPDGKTMISRGADNVIRRWDAESGKELGQFAEPKGTIGAVFAPDGKTAALANADGSIRVHAVADGKALHSLKGHTNGIAALAFSPDSKVLASRGSSDYTIRLYDVAKGGDLKQITLPGAMPAGGGGFGMSSYGVFGQTIVFSPDGQTLAANVNAGNVLFRNPGGAPAGNPENLILQWDVLTGKQIRKIALPPARNVVNLAYSPDGRVLAAENADQTLSLWEIASGRERGVLGKPTGPAQPGGQPFVIVGGGFGGRMAGPLAAATIAYSPDGSLLATRNADKTVRVWEVATRQEAGAFKGHEGSVQAIAFAPNGKTLASASADTTLLVWDLARLKLTPKAVGVKFAAKEVETLWTDLLGEDAGRAGASIGKLASASKQATSFMSEKLKPAAAPDVKKIDQWIADLDSANFAKRTKAGDELEKLGDLAVPALKKSLASQPTAEVRRRVEPLLEKLTTGVLSAEQVRMVRAVEALEMMASDEARTLLQALAKGAPGALSTRHAQAALDRMSR